MKDSRKQMWRAVGLLLWPCLWLGFFLWLAFAPAPASTPHSHRPGWLATAGCLFFAFLSLLQLLALLEAVWFLWRGWPLERARGFGLLSRRGGKYGVVWPSALDRIRGERPCTFPTSH